MLKCLVQYGSNLENTGNITNKLLCWRKHMQWYQCFVIYCHVLRQNQGVCFKSWEITKAFLTLKNYDEICFRKTVSCQSFLRFPLNGASSKESSYCEFPLLFADPCLPVRSCTIYQETVMPDAISWSSTFTENDNVWLSVEIHLLQLLAIVMQRHVIRGGVYYVLCDAEENFNTGYCPHYLYPWTVKCVSFILLFQFDFQ